MIGSRALAGELTPEELDRYGDSGGVSIAEAMRAGGYDPGRIGEAARPAGTVAAYVELHIEQGRVLENEDLPAGIVTGIAGAVWFRFVLEGETGHAGATPMSLRRDALAAAAEIVGSPRPRRLRPGPPWRPWASWIWSRGASTSSRVGWSSRST